MLGNRNLHEAMFLEDKAAVEAPEFSFGALDETHLAQIDRFENTSETFLCTARRNCVPAVPARLILGLSVYCRGPNLVGT
jgi:hypothetical protein